ncbi:L-dopachrome tautomerase-related protein [Massilia sp. YIM B02763]|uniref:L-dopachrome tautomerase-related protein n=1 Tax=Massilia sp. YIM B02763 TaxID=3050130 RepID=UPI0025B6B5CE|nr:L-dopachrome tautomerase-related protein [Massilia sp. YIM B02763]MDN4051939.1 L-dopachrome tautomerase-related protein [Massilia sp. YIM B02763]
MRFAHKLAACIVAIAATAAAAAGGWNGNTVRLEQVAAFGHQVTGVAVGERGRIFVNFPRWTEDAPVSVAEVLPGGVLRPYPDGAWNAWRNVRRDELDPADHWVCVQSVVADGRGSLWVLDPAAPAMMGPVPGGPKLVRIDLASNRVVQAIRFGQDVAIPGSYLNDVRFSPDGRLAFLTDSGQRGALVVVDLASGAARRVLDGHPSTQPERGVTVETDGRTLRYPDGRDVRIAADSIALSGDGAWLYWKPLTGTTLYRIPSAVLATRGLAGQDVAAAVQPYGQVGPTDGFWIGRGSDTLYVTSIEDNAVKARDLGQGATGGLRLVARDPRLRWPDSFAQGPDGALYVTSSRIQDSAWFRRDAPLALPTQLWRLAPR